MEKSEQESVVAIALLAAFADGKKDEAEHAAIRRVAEGFRMELVDMTGLYQKVIMGEMTLAKAAGGLTTEQAKNLAHEVARCICEADTVMHPAEEKFMADLTALIRPSMPTSAESVDVNSSGEKKDELSVIGPITDPEKPLDPTLIKYSILTAALELLPQTAGALAILPVQLKMVYDISQRHGIQIDYQSVKDFGAALGIGAAGQILEAGLRRVLSSVVGTVAGSTVGGMSSGVAGTAMTFATTYALGTVANQYFESGRKIDLAALKAEFSSLVQKAKVTQSQYTKEIADKAAELTSKLKNSNLASVLGGLVRGNV